MNETTYPSESPSQSPSQSPIRQLRRSRGDRMLAGVCGGLANYLRVDATLVRVGFAALTIMTGGTALLAYLIAWVVMPEE